MSETTSSRARSSAGLLALLLCCAGLLAAACAAPRGAAAPAAAGEDRGRPLAVATISVIADLVALVAGDDLEVASIVPVGGDPHTHEPTPGDARLVADADIVFANGLGLERWLDRLIAAGARGPVVTVTDGLAAEVLDAPAGAYIAPGGVDPHLWMDPVLAARYVDAIEQGLAAFDPAHAAAYARRAARARAGLAELDAWIAEQVARIPPERRQLVATHDAFRYFGARYGLEVVGTIWGVSTEREPSAAEIRDLVEAVRRARVPTVFVETTVSPRLMRRVAREAGVAVGRPLYGDSVGPPGSGADDYHGMMRANVTAIVDGLAP